MAENEIVAVKMAKTPKNMNKYRTGADSERISKDFFSIVIFVEFGLSENVAFAIFMSISVNQ